LPGTHDKTKSAEIKAITVRESDLFMVSLRLRYYPLTQK